VALASGLVKWKATLLGKWKDSVMKTENSEEVKESLLCKHGRYSLQ